MRKKTVIFGGSFNPPGTHHVKMITPLLVAFDEVIIVPCGDRPDKPTTGAVSAADRAAMAHLAFGNIATKVRVDDFDLTGGTFMRTIDLQARRAPQRKSAGAFPKDCRSRAWSAQRLNNTSSNTDSTGQRPSVRRREGRGSPLSRASLLEN
jgi:hypothetical protein